MWIVVTALLWSIGVGRGRIAHPKCFLLLRKK